MFNFKITKYVDLLNNDGLSSIENHAAQQHHDAYRQIYNLLDNVKPKRILEIGTALGGLTQFLDLSCRDLGLNTTIRSYDIHKNDWYDSICSSSMSIIVKNIFSDHYSGLQDLSVIDFLQQDGVSLVMCDGGSKKDEFNILSQYLKNNDIIMTHDYAPDAGYFNQFVYHKIWNWHEIKYSDIQLSIEKYSLKPFMHEEMLTVAWGCFRKEL